jgi:hypothetical protein
MRMKYPAGLNLGHCGTRKVGKVIFLHFSFEASFLSNLKTKACPAKE